MGPGAVSASEAASSERFFLGRRRELDDLWAAFTEARSGRGRLYLVRGEPGIGKTALAEELSARAAAGGAAVLWGRCWEGEGAPAYWPWVQLIRARIRSQPGVVAAHPDIASDLAQIVPELRARGVEVAAATDPEQARFRLFDSVTRFFRAAAAEKPALLVLDDLHGADTESLLLLRFLAGELRAVPMLVVGTYREGEARLREAVRPLMAEIAREARMLLLGGLEMEEVRGLAARRTRVTPVARMVDDLLRITEGNPFFVEEVLQLVHAEHGFEAHAAGGLRVPESVRDVIRRRVEGLPPATRELLGNAAVLGREFDVAVLEATAGLATGGAREHLITATSASVVNAAPSGRHRFSHALIAETLYEDLPFAQRVDLHRRAAQALLQCGGDVDAHLEEIAHHHLSAAPGGEIDTAIAWAERAGDQALTRLAFEAAASCYARALAVMQEVAWLPEAAADGQRRRIELLVRLGEARGRSGDVAGAEEALLEAAERARAMGDGQLLGRTVLALGAVRFERGRSDAAFVELVEQSLAMLGTQESGLRAKLMARLARAPFLARIEQRHIDFAAEAVEVARRCGDHGALASALTARHALLWQAGSGAERLALANEIVRLADDAADQELAVDGIGWRIFDLLELGRADLADAAIAEYERRAETHRLPRHRWYACVFRGTQAIRRGQFDEAERLAAKGLEVRHANDTSPSQFYAAQMFTIRREQGRLAELGAAVRVLMQQYPAVTGWLCALMIFHSEVGEIDEARAIFERLAASEFTDFVRDVNWLPSISMLAEVCAVLGDRRAARLYELMLPYADTNVIIVAGALCRGSVSYFLGLLAGTLGRWETARRHFEDACRRHEELSAWALTAHAQLRCAEACLRCGDAPASAELRQRALTTARSLGMSKLVAQAEAVGDAAAVGHGASFRRHGEHWAFAFAGQVTRVKASRGCEYMARLLGQPGERVSSMVLLGDSSPAADEEKARVAVRKAISVVLRAVEKEHDDLHRHLVASLKTGRWCAYEPDPELGVTWEVVP